MSTKVGRKDSAAIRPPAVNSGKLGRVRILLKCSLSERTWRMSAWRVRSQAQLLSSTMVTLETGESLRNFANSDGGSAPNGLVNGKEGNCPTCDCEVDSFWIMVREGDLFTRKENLIAVSILFAPNRYVNESEKVDYFMWKNGWWTIHPPPSPPHKKLPKRIRTIRIALGSPCNWNATCVVRYAT